MRWHEANSDEPEFTAQQLSGAVNSVTTAFGLRRAGHHSVMLDTSGAVAVADDLAGDNHDFTVPGLLAAAIWAVGFVIGVLALLTGHSAVAVSALAVAATGPWLGLAWAARAQRGAYNVAMPSHRLN